MQLSELRLIRKHANKPGTGTRKKHQGVAEYPGNWQLVHRQIDSSHVGAFKRHAQIQHFNTGTLPEDHQKR